MRIKTRVIARNEAISELCRSRNGNTVKRHLLHALFIAFFFILSLHSVAQKKDTIRATTMYDLLQQIKKQPGTSDPLVMVDDSVFKGDLHEIDSKDVIEVQVIKGSDAVQIYGESAKNGLFMVKTKKATFDGIPQPDVVPLPPKPESVLYVVDGVQMEKNPIATADILIRKSVSQKELETRGIYFEKYLDSVILIITKSGAIKSYENKLSSFNKEYLQYIAEQGNDQMCHYFIDDKSLDKEDKDFIVKLYQIPTDKIQSVIVQAPRPVDSFIGLNVRITTKK